MGSCCMSLAEEARLIERDGRLLQVSLSLGLTANDICYLRRFFYNEDVAVFCTHNGLSPEASALVQRWFGAAADFVTLEAFLLCMYDFVTTKPGQLPSLVFQLYDDAMTGVLDAESSAHMIHGLWKTPSPAVASAMARRGWTVLTEKTFKSLCGQFPEIMVRAFDLVELLRARSWGPRRSNQLRDERDARFGQQPLGDVLDALPVKPMCYAALRLVTRRVRQRRTKPSPAPVLAAVAANGKVGAEGAEYGRRAASESSIATAPPSAAPSRPISAAPSQPTAVVRRRSDAKDDGEGDVDDEDAFASPVPRKKPTAAQEQGAGGWRRERRVTR